MGEQEPAEILKEALKGSKCLKLSKDKDSVKRRTAFKEENIDKEKVDKCTIYLENFPSTTTNEDLAFLFSREGGEIQHIYLPRHSQSQNHKGYAFIQFKEPEQASLILEKLNNLVPVEFTDPAHPHYVKPLPTEDVKALKVISKQQWLDYKKDLQEIKAQMTTLCPDTMFKTQTKKELKQVKGSLVKIKGLDKELWTELKLREAVRHCVEPQYVEYMPKNDEAVVRFLTKADSTLFQKKFVEYVKATGE